MRKQLFILLFACISFHFASSQATITDSLRIKKDSTLRSMIHEDSLKVEKEFAEKEKWNRFNAKAEFPLLKGGKESGIIPIKDVTEIPDPNINYKLLFELTGNNPDSMAKEINFGLNEIARVINLHFAAGIPAKRIIPVIVVHAGAVNAIRNNEAYQKKYKTDNPNIKLIDDLKKIGAKFIICGQAMEFFETKKEDLLPDIKISLTAQTVVSYYQLKGFIWHPVW
jgi:predicted peroxiredoxin